MQINFYFEILPSGTLHGLVEERDVLMATVNI